MDEMNGNVSVVISSDQKGGKEKAKAFWHINKAMLPYKFHFFLFVGGMGAILPYHTAIGINRYKLTASNLGAVYTTQQVLFFVLQPILGYIADYFNRLKAFIVILTVIQAICGFFMIIIPQVDAKNFEAQVYIPSELEPCDFCDHHHEFQLISTKLQLNSSVLNQGITCLENIQNYADYYEVHCTNKKLNYPQLTSMKYKILQKSCNFPISKDVALSQHTSGTKLYEKNILLIFFTDSKNKNNYVICSYKEEKISSFVRSMKDYCYIVPELNQKSPINDMAFLNYPTTNVSCDTVEISSVPVVKNKHASLSSSLIFQTYQFWLFSICLISVYISISTIFTISDTACYESVHKNGSNYGSQRAWGGISWGFIAPFAGFLNDYTNSYMLSWCVMVLLCSLQICNLSKMDLIKPDLSQNVRKDLKDVFSSFEFIAFEVSVFLNGVFTGIIWFYFTWFIVFIGGNKLIIGLAHTVRCYFGVIPFMFWSHWLIEKFGHFNIMSLALLANGVRFLAYSFTYNPWWVLPVEFLHGITFGVFYTAMTSYGKLNSKPGTEATTQSVLGTTYDGFGAGVGCFISGMCFDRFGGHETFFYIALLCALATSINVVFTIILRYKKGKLEVTRAKSNISDRY